MELDAISAGSTVVGSSRNPTGELDASDFLQLLVTQLANQDPLEPTSNEALLQQLSSIRDIQLSSTLADSLETLTGNQRFGSAAALIGKRVSGHLGDHPESAVRVEGRVEGIRFDGNGQVTLELDSGAALPLEGLETVTESEATASSLLGQLVRGHDAENPAAVIEGIVTSVRRDDDADETSLELDTGESLLLSELIAAA